MGDVADLTAKAYDIARMIPPGRVTTYGQSAPYRWLTNLTSQGILLNWPDTRLTRGTLPFGTRLTVDT